MKPKPIICPNCGNDELAFVTSHKKCTWLRILCLITLFALIFFTYNCITTPEANQEGFEYATTLFSTICLSVLFIALKGIQWFIEEKTNVTAVCKCCRHSWIFDKN